MDNLESMSFDEKKELAKRLGIKGYISFMNVDQKIEEEHPDDILLAMLGQSWNGKDWVEQ